MDVKVKWEKERILIEGERYYGCNKGEAEQEWILMESVKENGC